MSDSNLTPNGIWIWIRRPLLVGCVFAVLALGITSLIPNAYLSEAKILPADARGMSSLNGGLAAAAAAVGVNIPGQDSADVAYVDILNSRWLQEKVLLDTYEFQIPGKWFRSASVRKERLIDYLECTNVDRAVLSLRRHLAVTRDIKSKLLTITFETTSPDLSAKVVQNMVKTLEYFILNKSTTRGRIKVSFVEKRLEDANMARDEAESAFAKFLASNRNFQTSSDPQVRLTGAKLENELKLKNQVVSSLAVGREQALLEEKNDMPILNVLESGNLPIEKSGPHRVTITLLAGLAGLILALLQQEREGIIKFLFRPE